MALKVRVLASNRAREEGKPQSTFYRAEGYDDLDPFREQKWVCPHEHASVEEAVTCGVEWLAEHGGEPEPG